MSSVNKVILIGRAGKDPELRYGTSGKAVCNLSVATSRNWKNANGEKQEETEWHNVVFYDKIAEIVGKYVQKGKQIYVEGRLKTRKWQDKATGADRYTTEVVADEMTLLGGNDGGSGSSQRQQGGYTPQRQAPRNAPAQEFDGDIPF